MTASCPSLIYISDEECHRMLLSWSSLILLRSVALVVHNFLETSGYHWPYFCNLIWYEAQIMTFYRLLGSLGFLFVAFDWYAVKGLICRSRSNFCDLSGPQHVRWQMQLQQQKKRPTIGGDFIELGSSLITLLNLAQEIGSSSNLRFRQAADKLRDQFARSFALRYDLEKSQFLSAALSSIDGDTQLTAGNVIISLVVFYFTSILIRVSDCYNMC